MDKLKWALWGVVFVGVVGCARTESSSLATAQTKQALRDLSAVPIGTGYDRALDVERAACFVRDQTSTSTVQRWEATGFSAFTGAEVEPRVRSAIVVGVRIDGETRLGAQTAKDIGSSGEQPRFVVVARFTARRETAGAIVDASSACAAVPTQSSNGLEDFVTRCGDSTLNQKTYGGHMLLSWKRSPTRPTVDELMGSMLGARTVGATFDLQSNLAALRATHGHVFGGRNDRGDG